MSLQGQEWRQRAKCLGTSPDFFYPDFGQAAKEARRICAQCEVRRDCLEYALAAGEPFGIWGGLNERERRKIARARRQKGGD